MNKPCLGWCCDVSEGPSQAWPRESVCARMARGEDALPLYPFCPGTCDWTQNAEEHLRVWAVLPELTCICLVKIYASLVCTRPTLVLAKAVASLFPWKGWSHILGARGAGLQLQPRWERPVFVQGSLGWQHRLLVCQGYSWRWLKWFVAFPCSSALVISISDLFCLPGKTRCFWLPALQTQSGLWKTTSSSFSASKRGVTYRETSA